MAIQYTQGTAPPGGVQFPQNWYPDPWGIAPWRWWDGAQWTPVLYGPYGEAWPLPPPVPPPFVPKGPGIKGGGVAAVGAGVGLVGTVAVGIAYVAIAPRPIDVNDPWYILVSQFALWVGFVGAVHAGTGRATSIPTTGCRGPGSRTCGWGSSAPSWAGSCRFSC
jgi:hypothetical protein